MGVAQQKKDVLYYVHIVIFLLITFGVGFLPPFAQITSVGMHVLGAFLGAIYGWLFIALDWPSLVALAALGLSGYGDSLQALFISGWSFYVIPQMILALLFAEGLAKTRFTSYVADKVMAVKIFRGKPYLLMAGCMFAMELMIHLRCGLAGMFLLWSLCDTIAEKAGYEKKNKFCMIMIPSILVVFILMGFFYPFSPGSVAQIGIFQKGMASLNPGIEVPFVGWLVWWLVFTNAYIVLWTLVVKYIFRLKFPEVAAIGDEIATLGNAEQKMNREQKFGLGILIFFMAGMLGANLLPVGWKLTQLLAELGMIGMLSLSLAIMAAYRTSEGQSFISLQEASKGITWNIIWLLVATEPLATAFNATECGIMPSLMTVITPVLTSMSSIVFLVVCLVVLGLVTQVVHNFILMVVFIPLLCPLYVQMGGNPFVLFMGLMIVLNFALATPAASYTSAMMFGQSNMDKKDAYIQGIAHFVFSLILFLLIGMPLANLCFPY